MIAAVSTVRNEADIIEQTIRHLLAEGLDRIVVADGMSSDGTRDILKRLRRESEGAVSIVDDTLKVHKQPYWINWLAAAEGDRGATWIVPFDADEYWTTCDGRTIAEVLADQPPEVSKLYARMFQYHDHERRELAPKPFPKVAYRYQPNARIRAGNHEVDGLVGEDRWNVLCVREIQYRSFEHFVRKMRERNETIDPELPADAGWHHRRLADYTDDQLAAEWEQMCSRETVLDPIPSRVTVP